MKGSVCPFSNKCRLYNYNLLDRRSAEIYRAIYCLTHKWQECKRYKVYQETGECSNFVMPNSKYDLETIIKQQEEEKKMFRQLNLPLP